MTRQTLPAIKTPFQMIPSVSVCNKRRTSGNTGSNLRGMKPEDMDVIAEAISLMLKSRDNREQAKALVKTLTDKYPLVG